MAEQDFRARYSPEIADTLKERTGTASFAKLLGIRVEAIEPGLILCSLDARADLHSGIDALAHHGGVIASLVEHTMSLAIYPLVESGCWVATAELKVNYLSPSKDGIILATGRVLSLGKRVGVVRVDVENQGRLVAAAQGTMYVRDKP